MNALNKSGPKNIHQSHKHVKVFGERNTGTHALTSIIEGNSESCCLPAVESAFYPILSRLVNDRRSPLPVRITERLNDWMLRDPDPLNAWKHCATNFDSAAGFQGILVLFTIRHPASWLLSFWKHPYHALDPVPATLEAFLRFRWRTVRRDNLNQQTFRPLQLYQQKLKSYQSLAERLTREGVSHKFVRLEDIILRQKAVFDDLAADLTSPKLAFELVEQSVTDPRKDLNFYISYYGEERWREELTGLENLINDEVSWDSFRPFGYAAL